MKQLKLIQTSLFCVALLTSGWRASLSCADWPQILGPNRDGKVVAAGHWLKELPKQSPTTLWEIPVGQGYAGAAISMGHVAVFDHLDGKDRIRLVSLLDGSVYWEQMLASGYRGGVNNDCGPRCVPTILPDAILCYGASGQLSCIERQDGKLRWTRPMRKEFDANDGYFGAGSTPLVVGDVAIVNVGGRKEGSVVAVRLSDGRTQWQTAGAEASYASPILWRMGEKQIIIAVTRLTTVGLNPENGEVLFDFKFGMRGPTVNAATPIQISSGEVFLTSSYGIGSSLIQPNSNPLSVVFRGQQSLSSQYITPIEIDGRIYGCDGREDAGRTQLVCLDPSSPETPLWIERISEITHLLGMGNHILGVGINGKLTLFQADPKRFHPVAKCDLPRGVYRALPAYSKGILLLRDSEEGSQHRLRAWNLNLD
jgi:outer membrane protein assembly factor BamB